MPALCSGRSRWMRCSTGCSARERDGLGGGRRLRRRLRPDRHRAGPPGRGRARRRGASCCVVGATDAEHAFFSEDSGIDWNVIFLLLGMMLIVAVLKRTGVFEYLAIWAAKRARGRPYRGHGDPGPGHRGRVRRCWTTSPPCCSIAPVTFLVCERLGVPVVPYLIAEVMACNIGGTATLIGDPPNIIIASRARPVLQRLPHPPGADRRRADGRLRACCAGCCSARRSATTRQRAAQVHGAARARRDPGPAAARRQPDRARRS